MWQSRFRSPLIFMPLPTRQDLLLLASIGALVGLAAATELRSQRLMRQLVRFEEQLELLARHAFHDPLTGLPNRTLLQDRLDHALAQARRHQQTLALMMLDLDGFKPINDRYGHELGDQALLVVARRLRQSLRAGDAVARMGGDEFVVLIEDLPLGEQVSDLAERILQAIAEPMILGPHQVEVTASIGVALAHAGQRSAQELMRAADAAMYAAKEAGKARVIIEGHD